MRAIEHRGEVFYVERAGDVVGVYQRRRGLLNVVGDGTWRHGLLVDMRGDFCSDLLDLIEFAASGERSPLPPVPMLEAR